MLEWRTTRGLCAPMTLAKKTTGPTEMPEMERTSIGWQLVIPGCERRTLPKSTVRADEKGQGLLQFYAPPTLREKLDGRAEAPLRPQRGQKAVPRGGLFGL